MGFWKKSQEVMKRQEREIREQEEKERREANKALYSMKIGDEIDYFQYAVARVPGGWLFYYYQCVVFVPYTSEGINE